MAGDRKVYDFDLFGTVYHVRPYREKYFINKRLAVKLEDVDDGSPFAVVTVNLNYPLSDNSSPELAFVDTNNLPMISDWLVSTGLAVPTGHIGYSGYCLYPEFKFDLEKVGNKHV